MEIKLKTGLWQPITTNFSNLPNGEAGPAGACRQVVPVTDCRQSSRKGDWWWAYKSRYSDLQTRTKRSHKSNKQLIINIFILMFFYRSLKVLNSVAATSGALQSYA